jgi:hypothetical protein
MDEPVSGFAAFVLDGVAVSWADRSSGDVTKATTRIRMNARNLTHWICIKYLLTEQPQ